MVEGDNFSAATPINRQEVVSVDEMEKSIRERVARLTGEELIQSLIDYIMLTALEIEFLKDPAPRPIWALGGHKVEVAQELSKVITPPSDRGDV